MRRRIKTLALAAAAALLCSAGAARVFRYNYFTVIHLVEQADYILLLKLSAPDKAGRVTAKVVKCFKGQKKAPQKAPVIDLAKTPKKAHAQFVRKMLAPGGTTALLFVGSGEEGTFKGLLHVKGKWLALDSTKQKHLWDLHAIDYTMEATWAGGTDMLLRAVEHVVKFPDTNVPIQSGVKWTAGPPSFHRLRSGAFSLQAVDLDGSGKKALHVACATGDYLFRYDPKIKKFIYDSALADQGAASRAACWADFDGDGLLDLAAWDGKALRVFYQEVKGAFGPGEKVKAAPAGAPLGLLALDAGNPGRPGLLWSAKTGPVLLAPDREGRLVARKLDLGGIDPAALGAPGRCLAADFDDDGVADVLWPAARGSLFFKGRGWGRFAAAKKLPLLLGKGRAGAFTGDFDMDGRLDVFSTAEDGCRLWHNRPGLRFEEVLALSGEPGYITKPGGLGGNACDINNDGLQDFLVFYSDLPASGPHIFFNNGFRSFGQAHSVDLQERALLPGVGRGQQCALVADLTGDGAQDLAVVLAGRGLYIFERDKQETPLCARVSLPPGGAVAGPVKVTAWNERRCLGAWNVTAGSAEAFLGQPESTAMTVRWRPPGGAEREKKFDLEDGPLRLVFTEGLEDLKVIRAPKPAKKKPAARRSLWNLNMPPGEVTAAIAAGGLLAAGLLTALIILARRRKRAAERAQ